MSDQQEKSDDLIAELAKLMASDAQGAEQGSKPSVIKLPPLNEATVQTTPVRIPGMDVPPPPVAAAPRPATPPPAAPVVRIPGMDRPVGVPDPQPSAPAAQRPQFDFGKPPSVTPVITPEPLSNWEVHQAQRSPAPAPTPSPAPMPTPAASSAPASATPLVGIPSIATKPANVTRFEPKPASSQTPTASPAASPAPAAEPAATEAKHESSAGDGFNFDFGFGTQSGGEQKQPAPPANDPIADLITAELDAAEAAPEHPAEPTSDPKIPHVSFGPQATPATARPAAPVPPQQRPAAAHATTARPVSVTPRPAEGDRFSVAPVFGLGSKPAATPQQPQQPSAPAPSSQPTSHARPELDPMDEIESLIGEAVRVELETPSPRPAAPQQAAAEAPQQAAAEAPQPSPAPVVPPLNTGFAPRRAQLKDAEPQVQAAEAAILAAAAASGAEVGRVDAPVHDDRPYKRMKVKPPKTSFVSSGARQYVGIAVAGTLLLAAGFGLYWVLGMNRDDPATAPVLTADATPVKVEPVTPVTAAAEPSGSVVFDEINGVADAAGEETLVSRDETDGASVTEVARAVTPEVDEPTETGLANRKVRTVTVRPDGTIVSGDDAVAGTEVLPVERPNVPEIDGAEIEPSDLLTAAVAGNEAAESTASTGGDAISAIVAETGAETEPVTPDPIDVAALQAADAAVQQTPPVFDGSLVAPIPMPRPADRTAMVGSGGGVNSLPLVDAPAPSANAPASTPLVAVAQPQNQAATPVRSGGGAYVQLSSQPSEAEAMKSLRALQQRMAGTLNGATLEIRQVEIPGRGTWYRVALPVRSFQDATQTCAAIKANGGDCVAING